MAGGQCGALTLVSMSLKPFGENQFGLLDPGISAERELTACEAVSLMTGSDDTILDDVSVLLTPSLKLFPLTLRPAGQSFSAPKDARPSPQIKSKRIGECNETRNFYRRGGSA